MNLMIRKRQRRPRKAHYVLLVNRQAFGYQAKAISNLISTIRAQGCAYTLYEPESAIDLLKQAEVACGQRQATQTLQRPFLRGGKVTGLIACGGDGTFNLVARAGLSADLPVGQYPLGKLNNFARSFYGTVEPAKVAKHLVLSGVRASDAAQAGNLWFFGSVGFGLAAALTEEMASRPMPRLGLGWSKLATRVASRIESQRVILKVDSFRFEIRPAILNIHLLSYAAGLPFSPASIPDDGHAEILFDTESDTGYFGAYTRLIHKKKYLYGDQVRLYRGKVISIQPVKGRTLCLDGEMIKVPTETVEIKIGEKKLQVLC